MADSFSRPPDHRCYSTLEAFKNTVDLHLKAYLQAVQYQDMGDDLSSGDNAAPALSAMWRECGQPSPIPNRCGR